MTLIAVGQLALAVGHAEANRAAARDAIVRVAAEGARLVVLPELTNSGYVFDSAEEARGLAEHLTGPTVSGWTALAREHDLVIVGGFCERDDDGAVRNSAVLVDADGPRAVYRKAHLWGDEPDFFVPGAQPPPVIDTAVGRVGLLICYDVEFPEWVRIPALAGADILAIPANWPAGTSPAGERSALVVNVQAAAYANRVFVALADRCGAERGAGWTGGSVLAGPDGYPLAGPVLADRPALLVAECDLRRARDKALGPRNDIHADRRTDLYRG
ncbi:MAG: nitrilase-related carbon-nitrogen hydrolase [Actinoallomurus sp.]